MTPMDRIGAGVAYVPGAERKPACVLIASRNGGENLAATISHASAQCPVYVVSDASDDDTADIARRAGAEVLELSENVGKPAAIHRAIRYFDITARYETVSVIDDDTTISPEFIRECLARMTAGVAIVVATTQSDWNSRVRWNPWVAARAFGYWKYQLFVRRGQSAINVMNCISGSNSMYRTELLHEIAVERTPYIVDDTYWTLEVQRRKLGRIVYAPRAKARVQDPTTANEWYRQNLRWLWGTMQGIVGHKVGRRATLFDLAYLGLIADWICYVLIWPMLLGLTFVASGGNPVKFFTVYVIGYAMWAAIGAAFLRKPQLVLMFPALMIMDWMQRVNFVHAFFKTIRQPQVESCRWESPTRYEAEVVAA